MKWNKGEDGGLRDRGIKYYKYQKVWDCGVMWKWIFINTYKCHHVAEYFWCYHIKYLSKKTAWNF